MNEHNEFLSLVASGLYASLLADLVAETDRDKRRLLIDQRYYTGKLWRDSYTALGYTPGSESVMRCWDFVEDRYYNPRFSASAVPFVVDPGISEGDTLTADATTGYTINVYTWDFIEFILLGPLSEHSQPGAGNYVLTLIDDADENNVGLPSVFLELT